MMAAPLIICYHEIINLDLLNGKRVQHKEDVSSNDNAA